MSKVLTSLLVLSILTALILIVLWLSGFLFTDSSLKQSPSPTVTVSPKIECEQIGKYTRTQTLASNANGTFGSSIFGPSDSRWIITGDSETDASVFGYRKLVVRRRNVDGLYNTSNDEELSAPDGTFFSLFMGVSSSGKYVTVVAQNLDLKTNASMIVYETSETKVFYKKIETVTLKNPFIFSVFMDNEIDVYPAQRGIIDGSSVIEKYRISNDSVTLIESILPNGTSISSGGSFVDDISEHTLFYPVNVANKKDVLQIFTRTNRDGKFTFSQQLSAPVISGLENTDEQFGSSAALLENELVLYVSANNTTVESKERSGVIFVFTRNSISEPFIYVENSWFNRQSRKGTQDDHFGFTVQSYRNDKLFIGSGEGLVEIPQKFNVYNVTDLNKGTVQLDQVLESFALSKIDIGSFALLIYVGFKATNNEMTMIAGHPLTDSTGASGNTSTLFVYKAKCE